MPPPLRICFLTSEIAPFAKAGGLGDVSAALGRFLAGRGHQVRAFLPLYPRVREVAGPLQPVPDLQDYEVEVGGRSFWVSVSTARLPNSHLRVSLIRCPELYERESIYTDDADEPLRFAVHTLAALEACRRSNFHPHVVHCNDWPSALAPLYLRTRYDGDPTFAVTRSVLTIHNLGYQGVFGTDVLPSLGLEEHRGLLYQEDLEQGHVNFLKTGLLYANILTTVSRTYAEEIQTEEHGAGLHELLQQRRDTLLGIVNGVDYGTWDPRDDSLIPHHFTPDDLDGKAEMKRALMERTGLEFDERAPLCGIVSRLTYQKGFELLPDVLPVFLQQGDLRLVVLGTGEEKYEGFFRWLAETYPERVHFHNGYDEELAHWIEAGSDVFLMPSRYEPCGLNQMYSLRYGTIPIVRETGGLADTVEPYDADTGEGTGFRFREFEANALFEAMREALVVYRDQVAWAKLMQNAMARDYSWDRQGQEYEKLYRQIVPEAAGQGGE